MTDTRHTGRYVIIAILVLLAWGRLSYRLFALHLGASGSRRERLEHIRHLEKKVAGGRGRILDCKGRENVLALDLLLKDVIVDPDFILTNKQVNAVVAGLAPVLHMSQSELEMRLNNPGKRFERLRRFVPDDTVRKIEALRLPGVYFSEARTRCYPQNSFMCHVLGFANYEGVGSSGIEQTMNAYLHGRAGAFESKLDGRRRELYDRRVQDVAPVDGADVYLTLDQHLQYSVEKALDDVMAKHRAKGAWAIIQNVRTGEILAMASRPAFNLNEFPKAGEQQRLNRTIGQVYEPGSTLKAVAVSAVLNEGIVSPSKVLFCENGAWHCGGRPLRDYHPYGNLSVADVVKKSSNIGVAKLAAMLGEQRLFAYLTAFGLGEKAGIDLPGEENGILHPVREWSGVSCSRISIGQGVAVTALQMLGIYCTIANDGVRMKPYVVKRVVGQNGVVLYEQQPRELGRPIKPETAATMRKLLARVTEDGGTGVRARVSGYSVAGKTGTAQKPVAGGYSSTDYFASFVGFLPAEDPELGIIVAVEEPQPYHTGGVVAAPAFGAIAGEAVRYLDIPSAGAGGPLVASAR